MTFHPPPREHACPTPAPFQYDYLDDGTLWQCPDCARWWVGWEIRSHPGDRVIWARGTVRWFPVMWWHFRLRRRIAALQQDSGERDG